MSSIRLFILSSLTERGPLHGHALRALAEQEHVDEWTDITPGALYGALKRMLAEGLIKVERTEREGNYPERQVYGITPAGTNAERDIRDRIFAAVDTRHDPFDLAFSRLDAEQIDDLEHSLRRRRDGYQALLDEELATLQRVEPQLWRAKRLAWMHKVRRLETEVAWHDELLSQVADIIADEKERWRKKGRTS